LVNFNGNSDGQFFNLPDNTIPSGDSAFTIFFAIRLAKDAAARFHDILLAGLWSNPITLLRIDNGSGFKFSIFSGGGSTTLVWPKTANQQLGTLILFTAGYANTNQRSFLINVNGTLATQMNVPVFFNICKVTYTTKFIKIILPESI